MTSCVPLAASVLPFPSGFGVEPGVHGTAPDLTHCWALRNQPDLTPTGAIGSLGPPGPPDPHGPAACDGHAPCELDSGREHLCVDIGHHPCGFPLGGSLVGGVVDANF